MNGSSHTRNTHAAKQIDIFPAAIKGISSRYTDKQKKNKLKNVNIDDIQTVDSLLLIEMTNAIESLCNKWQHVVQVRGVVPHYTAVFLFLLILDNNN